MVGFTCNFLDVLFLFLGGDPGSVHDVLVGMCGGML